MSIWSLVSRHYQEPTGGATGHRDQALDELTRYIPTETITLFIASLGIHSTLTSALPFLSLYFLYGLWAFLTPIVVLLVAVGQHRKAGGTGAMSWPIWPMVASLTAFSVWALAVPGMVDSEPGKILAAFGALLVSKMLSLVEPIFGR